MDMRRQASPSEAGKQRRVRHLILPTQNNILRTGNVQRALQTKLYNLVLAL